MASVSNIRPISAEETRPLRLAVLRKGGTLSDCVFEGDENPDTLHLGAFAEKIIGVLSMYSRPLPAHNATSASQIRGMAVLPEYRGQNVGRDLLREALQIAKSRKIELVWCNARINARGFYERMGFETDDESFEIPGIGLHFKMWVFL